MTRWRFSLPLPWRNRVALLDKTGANAPVSAARREHRRQIVEIGLILASCMASMVSSSVAGIGIGSSLRTVGVLIAVLMLVPGKCADFSANHLRGGLQFPCR